MKRSPPPTDFFNQAFSEPEKNVKEEVLAIATVIGVGTAVLTVFGLAGGLNYQGFFAFSNRVALTGLLITMIPLTFQFLAGMQTRAGSAFIEAFSDNRKVGRDPLKVQQGNTEVLYGAYKRIGITMGVMLPCLTWLISTAVLSAFLGIPFYI